MRVVLEPVTAGAEALAALDDFFDTHVSDVGAHAACGDAARRIAEFLLSRQLADGEELDIVVDIEGRDLQLVGTLLPASAPTYNAPGGAYIWASVSLD